MNTNAIPFDNKSNILIYWNDIMCSLRYCGIETSQWEGNIDVVQIIIHVTKSFLLSKRGKRREVFLAST